MSWVATASLSTVESSARRRPHRSLPHPRHGLPGPTQSKPRHPHRHSRPRPHRPRRPSRLHHLRVNGRPHHIGVGRTHARTRVLILVHDLNTRIINATNGELLRDFTHDPTNDYQPTGAPKGGFDRAAHASATDVDRHRYLAQSVTQRGLA